MIELQFSIAHNLLTDHTYIDIIKKTISHIKNNDVMENKSQLWDFVKSRIRSEIIAYLIQKSKTNRLKEKNS